MRRTSASFPLSIQYLPCFRVRSSSSRTGCPYSFLALRISSIAALFTSAILTVQLVCLVVSSRTPVIREANILPALNLSCNHLNFYCLFHRPRRFQPYVVEFSTRYTKHRQVEMQYTVGVIGALVSLAAAGPLQPTFHARDGLSVTAAPTQTLAKRNASSTPVSDCEYFADPDDNGPSGCQCSGYTGLLPTLQGNASCGYTAITGTPTAPTATWTTPAQTTGAVSGFPFTTTLANSAVVAYQSSTMSDNVGYLTGSSTVVTSGTQLNIQQDPTASVNAGTMSGNALYTAVSSSIAAACPTPSGTVNSCNNVSSIDSISYLDSNQNLQTNGELVINLPIVNYSSATAREFMIEAIAQLVNATTLNSTNANTVTPTDPNVGNPYGFVPPTDSPITLYNAPAVILSQFTDAGSGQEAQTMLFQMSLEEPEQGGGYSCAMGALALDAIGLLGLIPGLEWIGVIDAPAAAALSATCLAVDVAGEEAGGG